MRKLICLFLSLLLAACLTCCGFKSGEELYALPQASAEYDSLQSCLQTILKEGLEYAAPLTGSNTQPVQLADLDSDGRDEAIAFFRDSSTERQSLKIYIFRELEEHAYAPVLTIEGNGTAINSVVPCQLEGGSGSMFELMVSWQLSNAVYSLSAYSLNNYTLTEMMSGLTYTKYAVEDMDRDGDDEIVVVHLDSSDQSRNRAEYYVAADGALTLRSSVPLSARMGAMDRIHNSTLPGNIPALYVNCFTLDQDGEVSSSAVVTDVLALRDGKLTNVSMDPDEGNSSATLRTVLAQEQDINNDGVLEIPIPTPLPAYDESQNNELLSNSFSALRWLQYRLNGDRQIICTTFHNAGDGWYLTLPDPWEDHISLIRADISTSMTMERSVVFFHQPADGGEPEPFLTIYKNTGNDRQARAEQGSRFLLLSDPDTIYSAEFHECAWDCGLDRTSLAERFHLIRADWISG